MCRDCFFFEWLSQEELFPLILYMNIFNETNYRSSYNYNHSAHHPSIERVLQLQITSIPWYKHTTNMELSMWGYNNKLISTFLPCSGFALKIEYDINLPWSLKAFSTISWDGSNSWALHSMSFCFYHVGMCPFYKSFVGLHVIC